MSPFRAIHSAQCSSLPFITSAAQIAYLTSAITSPLHDEVRYAIWAADVMNGNDEHCADWIARNGDTGEAAQFGRRGGREGRRRAATA